MNSVFERLISHNDMSMKCAEDPFNEGIRFLTEGVLKSKSILGSPTHTSRHFILESAPPPLPGGNYYDLLFTPTLLCGRQTLHHITPGQD